MARDLDVRRQLESGQVVLVFAGRTQLIDSVGVVPPQHDVASTFCPGDSQGGAPSAGAKNSCAFNVHFFGNAVQCRGSGGKCSFDAAISRRSLGQWKHTGKAIRTFCESKVTPARRRASSQLRLSM